MSNYKARNNFETTFDGDTVKVVLLPLQTVDAMEMMQIKGDDIDSQTINIFRSWLPKYVESMTGLKDAAGSDVTIEKVCTDTYFARLIGEIGAEIIKNSRPLGTATSIEEARLSA